jgi:transcriptional regulator with XRE-family HTH domain
MENLKKFRTHLSITQEELAKKINVDQQTISIYEKEISFPSFHIIKKLADIFQISLDYLIHDENCFYPRNLKFMRLAEKIDKIQDQNIKNTIETSVSTFLNNKTGDFKLIRQDKIKEVELTESFHVNLKAVRNYKDIRQVDFAQTLGISTPLLGMYEKKIYPSVEKLKNISKNLEVSMHALATGEKLFFDFEDRPFGKTMLLADHFLSLEHQKFIIELMVNLTKTQPA